MSIDIATEQHCGWCGSDLTPEELEYPASDFEGNAFDEPICDECFHDHFEFTCNRCGNYEYEEFQHYWLVVFETDLGSPREAPITPGIYEIVSFPYYGGPIIGGCSLYGHSLRRTKATIDFRQGNYPCGHLCRTCAKNLHLRQSKRGKQLHAKKNERS